MAASTACRFARVPRADAAFTESIAVPVLNGFAHKHFFALIALRFYRCISSVVGKGSSQLCTFVFAYPTFVLPAIRCYFEEAARYFTVRRSWFKHPSDQSEA